MWLEPDRCYRALTAHDARFDGRFFVGVSSTRIYCRPVCRVRRPRREHCRFFPSAAAAEAGGFRPCLRCRPELAPGNGSIDAAQALAARAAGLIEDGLLADGGGLEPLARRLGVTSRHLRRVFHDEFGVSPIAFAQTQRLLLAKRLLTDTRLPIIDVALGSGFSSLRRFNDLFKARYRLTPSDLRKRSEAASHADGFRFVLRYQPPFDWRGLVGFLAQRAIDGVEHVAEGAYRRTLRLPHGGIDHDGWIEVTQQASRHALSVRVAPSLARVLPLVVGRVKRIFDLSCPIRDVELVLGPLARARPGLRVPGTCDGFELAVRAVLGQQVTVAAARTLAGRFARAFGTRVDTPFDGVACAFPTAARIASVAPDDIAALGVVTARARAIVATARAVADGAVVLEPGGDLDATMEALRRIPGVGEWTAHYVAMRALAWPDAFPAGDVGVLKGLGETSATRARVRADAWRPWRAYAVVHLWRSLEDAPPRRRERRS